MRALLATSVMFLALVGCSAGGDDPKAADEIAALKKRITKLENRVRQLEGRVGRGPGKGQPPRGKAPRGKAPRGKAPGGGAPPAGPTRQVTFEGDAKAVMLAGNQRRYKLPGQVPAGKYMVLVAFGEETLAKKGEIAIAKGEGPVKLQCTQALDGCKAQ